MLDLTDFTKLPRESFAPKNETPLPPMKNVMKPISDHLIDAEMVETKEREDRNPMKKHFWNINDFEGLPYDADDAARQRKARGIKEIDESKSEHLE